jgi:hypothetical protein
MTGANGTSVGLLLINLSNVQTKSFMTQSECEATNLTFSRSKNTKKGGYFPLLQMPMGNID